METTCDAILGGRLRMRQPKRGYRIAIDPILLAASVPAKAGDRVLDAGCGVGAAGLALASRVQGVSVVGIELQEPLAELARENVRENDLTGSVTIEIGSILTPPEALVPESFDHMIANPPYMKAGEATPPPDPVAAGAVIEGEAKLVDWAAFAARMLRPGGRLSVVHRADRLADLAKAMALAGFADLLIFPLWPTASAARAGDVERDARRVIVAGTRGAEGPTRRLDGLVLHDADGGFMAETEAILRHAEPLDLGG